MGDLQKRDERRLGLKGWIIGLSVVALLGVVAFALLRKQEPEAPEQRAKVSAASRSQLVGERIRSESSVFRGKWLEAKVLIDRLEVQMLAGEVLDPDVLSRLSRVVRSVGKPAQRISMLQLMPWWLCPHLADVALEVVQEVPYETDRNTGYSDIVKVLGRTPAPGAGEWLLRQLEEAPDFEYPEVSPHAWFSSFGFRGVLGEVAKAVVTHGGLGDPAVMDAYAQAILTNEGERQRVLIWALGESRDYADFEFLAAARRSVKDPVIQREMVLSLNKIAAGIGWDADSSSDPDNGEFGPHYFSVFPMLGDERQTLAERQAVAHEKAVAYLKANGLEDPEFHMKY